MSNQALIVILNFCNFYANYVLNALQYLIDVCNFSIINMYKIKHYPIIHRCINSSEAIPETESSDKKDCSKKSDLEFFVMIA